MENARANSDVRYDEWVKVLNSNTKFSNNSKLKPKATSSHINEEKRSVRRERKILTSEIWLG